MGMKVINKILVLIFFFFISFNANANEEFTVRGQIIHPIIIDCLYSLYTCWENEETPEVVYFKDIDLEYYNNNKVIEDGYYYHRVEDFFADWKGVPEGTKEFYTNVGYMKYKVIEQLDDINADLKTDKHIRTYDWGSETGKFSYWLIDAFSTGGGTHFHDVNLIVELFTSDRPYNNYLRLVEIK